MNDLPSSCTKLTLEPAAPLAPGRVVATRVPAPDTWFVLQYLQSMTGRGALLAARNGPASPATLTVRPRGLQPETRYIAIWADGRPAGYGTGAELRTHGLTLEREPYSGGIVWLTPEPVGPSFVEAQPPRAAASYPSGDTTRRGLGFGLGVGRAGLEPERLTVL